MVFSMSYLFRGLILQVLFHISCSFRINLGFPYYSSLSPNGNFISWQPSVNRIFFSPVNSRIEVRFGSYEPDVTTELHKINDLIEDSLTSRLFSYLDQLLQNDLGSVAKLRGSFGSRYCLHDCLQDIEELCVKEGIDVEDRGAVIQCLMVKSASVSPKCKLVLDKIEQWEDESQAPVSYIRTIPVEEIIEADRVVETIPSVDYVDDEEVADTVSQFIPHKESARLQTEQAERRFDDLQAPYTATGVKNTIYGYQSGFKGKDLIEDFYRNVESQLNNEILIVAIAGCAFTLISIQLILYIRRQNEPDYREFGYVPINSEDTK